MTRYQPWLAKWLALFFLLTSPFTLHFAFASPSTVVSSLESQAQIYHTQDRSQLREAIMESLQNAQKSILILTFSFSDDGILTLLNQKVQEGVRVTVIVDKEHLTQIYQKRDPNLEVITRHSGEGHLHHKILVVDEREIWIGSANFTPSAYTGQENMMLRFVSSELGNYLHREADAFRGKALRTEHAPLLISLHDQELYFCLLPHDGYPPKKVEKAINMASKKRLLDTINRAQNNIKIAMMVWTNHDLANAVIQAHQRGVKVEVLAPDFGGVLPELMKAGISVKVNSKLSFMHHKFMWVDGNQLVNGSANWSQSSFTRNDESFILINQLTADQQEVLASYWNYLWPEP